MNPRHSRVRSAETPADAAPTGLRFSIKEITELNGCLKEI